LAGTKCSLEFWLDVRGPPRVREGKEREQGETGRRVEGTKRNFEMFGTDRRQWTSFLTCPALKRDPVGVAKISGYGLKPNGKALSVV